MTAQVLIFTHTATAGIHGQRYATPAEVIPIDSLRHPR